MLAVVLNARIVGRGEQAVVLSHGFGSDQSAWDALVPALAERRRVVLYDLACAGTVDPERFDLRRYGELDGYAQDLIALLHGLAVPRCHFVGHSMSGMIGILAAARRPDLFAGLVTLGASARYLDDGDYRGGFGREELGAILDALAADFREWSRSFGPFMLGRAADDPAARTFVGSLRRMRPDVALSTARMALCGDLRGRLKACAVPTVVLQSRSDPAVPPEAARYLADNLPDARLELLDADGHLPHLTAPDVVLDALLRHLGG